jgi:acetyl esterase/lipase
MSINSIMINYLFTQGDKKRDKGLQTPVDIERKDNLSYGSHGKWSLLDVYSPKENQGALPVIVNIHGGGWVYGTKEVYQYYCMSLAQRGFAVVNFNYRLAPASKFPAPLEDLNQVIHWIFEHAAEQPFDLKRIFFVGDSAGANIAALYSCLCVNPDYARMFTIQPPAGFVPKAVALNCGMYHIYSVAEQNAGGISGLLKDFLGKKYGRDDLEKINVSSFITRDFPPTYLMTADYDFLKFQAPYMKEKLDEFQITHEYKIYGNGNKKVGHVFHCNIRLPEAKQCNDEECEFFKSIG